MFVRIISSILAGIIILSLEKMYGMSSTALIAGFLLGLVLEAFNRTVDNTRRERKHKAHVDYIMTKGMKTVDIVQVSRDYFGEVEGATNIDYLRLYVLLLYTKLEKALK